MRSMPAPERCACASRAADCMRLMVEDDGHGMSADELPLAIERHATSKLSPDDDGHVDLLDIRTMGFRGEALPSIGSVSRLAILSRAQGRRWRVRDRASMAGASMDPSRRRGAG